MVVWFGTGRLAQAARLDLDLSGTWQYQKVSQLSYPPPSNWSSIAVPGYLASTNYEHAWYRTTFTLPALDAGTRVRLRFVGVKFDSKVWVNGTQVGGYLNGYEPFELDITAAAHVGASNELIVGLTDWTATFSKPVDFSNLAPYENPRDHARDAILAPIGGRYDLYGIWQAVHVVCTPPAALADVFVMPSVRQRQLGLQITVRNDSTTPQNVVLRSRVQDGTATVLSFPDQQLALDPSSTQQVALAAQWLSPRLWSHLDPYLYHLETTLDAGTASDAVTNRFGFRELWTQGAEYYLNGTNIHLLATATWPPETFLSRAQIASVFQNVKAANNVAMRLHTQPWDELFYDVADEVGIMIVEEGAVWCDAYSYRLEDPTFWTNYSRHLAAAVKRDRNHPSLVQWSLENELLSVGGNLAYTGTVQRLAQMGAVVRAADPTRLITYESDLDPGGAADVIGLHYPHEYPDFALWPNSAYWMNDSIARDWASGGRWTWQRDKPLYIGEFLWVPGTSAEVFSILYGDAPYADTAGYRNLAKTWTWQMQVEAYRSYGVNGMSPWTMFEDPAGSSLTLDLNPSQNALYQAQKAAYHPNAVFVQPYSPRFFIGDSSPRTFTIYNDTMFPGSFVLKWRAGDQAVWESRSFNLAPAAKQSETVSLNPPTNAGPFGFEIELDNGSSPVFTNTLAYNAWPKIPLSLPAGVHLAVYDPLGDTVRLLTAQGIPFVTVTNLRTANYNAWNLLVIGANTLANDTNFQVGADLPAAKWEQFTDQGGWILLLEQQVYPRWMPLGLNIENVPATFSFPNQNHVLAQGLSPEDLRWWAGDHLVARKAIRTPSRGNFRVPIQIGSLQGLEYAGLLEISSGRGGILCSQMLLAEKFDTEPMTRLLWQRVLNYCSATSQRRPLSQAGLVTEAGSALAAKLASLGLVDQQWLGQLDKLDAQVCPLLVIGGGQAAWADASNHLATLASYVNQGGKLLLHRPTDAFLSAAAPSLFPQLGWASGAPAQVLHRDATNLAVNFVNHDLHWVDQPGDWNRPEVLSTNMAQRFYRKNFNLTSYTTLHAESMPIHNGGGGAVTGGWELWAAGYVGQHLTISQPGSYLFSVTARGTPAAGVYPLMTLRIDGEVQDAVFLQDNTWRAYTLSADLTAGDHLVAISFDNDFYQPPEDRNLFVGQILFGLDSDTGSLVAITKPAVVAQARLGRGLILLDEILWESEAKNQTKAERLASTIFTALDAALPAHPSLTIQGTEMKNIDVAAYSTNGSVFYMNSGGNIQVSVAFTTTGTYKFDLIASGTPAVGVWPIVQLKVDGGVRKAFSVTNTSFGHYSISLSIAAGTHVVGLAFINDYYAPPEDRNAAVEQLMISPDPLPRILSLNLDTAGQAATLVWEAVPGKTYHIDALQALGSAALASILVTNADSTAASWTDDGTAVPGAPGTSANPQRFYRLRTP